MMENLRAAANHTALKIILTIILIAFALSGVGSYLISGHSDYVVKVNGQEISRASYQNALTHQRAQLQQQLGNDGFSEFVANENNMRQLQQQVLDQLINQILLEQYSKKLALSTSDEQIKQAIFNTAAFQKNDKFDNATFNQILQSNGLTADQYASQLRTQLTNQQLLQGLTDTDFILKGEADRLSALLAQQRVIREATIQVSDLAKKQTASDEEIKNYYQAHQNDFTAPEQFRVNYIELDATDIQTSVTEEEIASYYQQHKDNFTQPQQFRFSIIQSNSEAQANTLLEKLKQGTDFASLAKQESTDIISANKGGDMGWLNANTLPDELKNAGLSQKGQLSGVIKLQGDKQYLIVRLDDSKPASVAPLEQVRDSIANKLKQEKSLDAWYALQQKVSTAASNDNESLDDAAKLAGVKIEQTDWFSRDELPKALDYKPVREAIFNGGLLTADGHSAGNSDVITTEGDRAFVLHIADHKAKASKPLSEVREQVITAVKQQKAIAQARQQAEKLLAQLNSGKGDAALSAAGLSFSAEQTLNRHDNNPLAVKAFSMSPPASGKPRYAIAENTNGDIVLLALEQIKTDKITEQEQKLLSQTLAANNAQLAFVALISNLRSEASIKQGVAIDQ